ncbi:putative 2-deoxyglucose-6-phosphate phosphatase [Microdochium bolleyi]|uniref:Putative 2-deoxyglucose-6-phosphate phosphatase n=1 Tax=Microdochium bolleyi TaxID=196109 RepID=A0A136ILP4_9PEZI|nr:putative 2-deoxyglucose-6-phosphate phosphatase [Microdochium bolleyi]
MATSTSEPSASAAPWRPKAVVFDLLTALLDSWTLWDASTPSGTEAEGRPWRARYLEITFGTGRYEPYEDLVRQAAREVGLPDSAPQALLDKWAQLQAWPEVAGVLERLKARGYRLGVVTNCSVEKGHEEGGYVVFDEVITAAESGFYKPAPEAYRAIMTAMGLGADEILFVAGSAGDVQGATDAGMRVVWHNKVGLPRKEDAVPLREGRDLEDALEGFL